MDYVINLKLPAVFALARILKYTNTKDQVKTFLDSDIDVEKIKKGNGNPEEELGLKVLMKAIELYIDIAGHSEQAEQMFYELFVKISNATQEQIINMEFDELIEFFKAFAKARGVGSFFGQALKSKE